MTKTSKTEWKLLEMMNFQSREFVPSVRKVESTSEKVSTGMNSQSCNFVPKLESTTANMPMNIKINSTSREFIPNSGKSTTNSLLRKGEQGLSQRKDGQIDILVNSRKTETRKETQVSVSADFSNSMSQLSEENQSNFLRGMADKLNFPQRETEYIDSLTKDFLKGSVGRKKGMIGTSKLYPRFVELVESDIYVFDLTTVCHPGLFIFGLLQYGCILMHLLTGGLDDCIDRVCDENEVSNFETFMQNVHKYLIQDFEKSEHGYRNIESNMRSKDGLKNRRTELYIFIVLAVKVVAEFSQELSHTITKQTQTEYWICHEELEHILTCKKKLDHIYRLVTCAKVLTAEWNSYTKKHNIAIREHFYCN